MSKTYRDYARVFGYTIPPRDRSYARPRKQKALTRTCIHCSETFIGKRLYCDSCFENLSLLTATAMLERADDIESLTEGD